MMVGEYGAKIKSFFNGSQAYEFFQSGRGAVYHTASR